MIKKHFLGALISLCIVAFGSWLILQLTAWSLPTWFDLSVRAQQNLIGISLGVGFLTLLVGLRQISVRQNREDQK